MTQLTLLQLMREAEVHVGQLVNMLRAPGVAALPGTVAIVAVKAAGSIAQQRPFFMNKILPVLVSFGSAQVRIATTLCNPLRLDCHAVWLPVTLAPKHDTVTVKGHFVGKNGCRNSVCDAR